MTEAISPIGIDELPRKNPWAEAIEQSKKNTLPMEPPKTLPFSQDCIYPSLPPLPSYDSSRPKLPPPAKAGISDLLTLQVHAEKLLDRLSQSQVNELKEASERYEKFAIEHAKKQKELLHEQENASSWERARFLSAMIGTSLTFFAATMTGPGGAATTHLTYALLFSGSTALFNEMMALSGGWKWLSSYLTHNESAQATIASIVEKGLSIGSTMIGMLSLGSVASTLQIGNAQFWKTNLTAGISTFSDIAHALLGIKSGLLTSKSQSMEADLKISEKNTTQYANESHQTMKAFKETLDTQSNLNEACHSALQNYVESCTIAASSV